MNPKVEGFIDGTPDRRAEAREYIMEQIKAHRYILCYYKKHLNALTVTCRIPNEILAIIFRQVVDAEVAENILDSEWIPSISHVCSHWREVALSTPALWSTLHLDYPAWAPEMLRRSKDVALSVKSYGTLYEQAYYILHQILTSHLHRVKHLSLINDEEYMYNSYPPTRDGKPVSRKQFQELMRLLVQHSVSGPLKLEWLAIATDSIEPPHSLGPRIQSKFPDSIIRASPSLKHLQLHGFELNYGLRHKFDNLEKLILNSLPDQFKPLLFQLLPFLSQMPRLQTFVIDEISPAEGVLPSDNDRIHLKYLTEISVCCRSPTILDSFFAHVKFPKDGVVCLRSDLYIETQDMGEVVDRSSMSLRNLGRQMDQATDGLVSRLAISMHSFDCWKSAVDSPVLRFQCGGMAIIAPLLICMLQDIRLDQLVTLELEAPSNPGMTDVLSLLDNLPRITELKVYREASAYAIKSLCRGYDNRVNIQTGPADSQPGFPALTTLILKGWKFEETYNYPWPQARTIEALLYCAKIRTLARRPIKVLRIQRCTACAEEFIPRLKEFIEDVIQTDDTSSDEDEDEDEGEDEGEDEDEGKDASHDTEDEEGVGEEEEDASEEEAGGDEDEV
ncbi:hypothetical protein H0H92_010804 [Tricholoma furcatifolium]|nr:hypothetical protein H0H92_010804 [Tricholoma furcatifolium]